MDAITLLKNQHAEVKSLFLQFQKAEGAAKRRKLFEAVADHLAAHCEVEEKLFYPAAFRAGLEGELEEAVEEHLSAKRVIADLLEMEPTDPQYDPKMSVLQELIEHHVKEETGELFPAAREALEARELKSLGVEMEQLFETLMASEPRNLVRDQVERAAVLPPPASTGRKGAEAR